MTMATDVSLELDDSIALLRLDGEERMNAIGSHTYRALASAVGRVEKNGQTRAVVIYGAGRVFCAGADIEEIAGFASDDEFRRFVHGFTDSLELLSAARCRSPRRSTAWPSAAGSSWPWRAICG